jgi:hypothetical protein
LLIVWNIVPVGSIPTNNYLFKKQKIEKAINFDNPKSRYSVIPLAESTK